MGRCWAVGGPRMIDGLAELERHRCDGGLPVFVYVSIVVAVMSKGGRFRSIDWGVN